VCTLLLAASTPALAQTPAAPARPRGPARPVDVTVGVTLAGPTSFGTSAQELIRSDGSRLTTFRTENRLAPGVGLEAHLGFQVTPRFWAEASGDWSRADLEARITSDIEGADDVTLAETASRFSVEGAARWHFLVRGKTSYFVRGSVGWMRDLVSNGALVADATVGSAGLGLRHWFREGAAGRRTRRLGVRVDGRVNIRTAGLTLGEAKVRYAPVAFGGFVFGF
jgi:hypothetical protein